MSHLRLGIRVATGEYACLRRPPRARPGRPCLVWPSLCTAPWPWRSRRRQALRWRQSSRAKRRLPSSSALPAQCLRWGVEEVHHTHARRPRTRVMCWCGSCAREATWCFDAAPLVEGSLVHVVREKPLAALGVPLGSLGLHVVLLVERDIEVHAVADAPLAEGVEVDCCCARLSGLLSPRSG